MVAKQQKIMMRCMRCGFKIRKVRGKFVTFGIICALSRVVNKIHTPPSQPNLKESNSPAGVVRCCKGAHR